MLNVAASPVSPIEDTPAARRCWQPPPLPVPGSRSGLSQAEFDALVVARGGRRPVAARGTSRSLNAYSERRIEAMIWSKTA